MKRKPVFSRALSVVLSVVMAFSSLPLIASAGLGSIASAKEEVSDFSGRTQMNFNKNWRFALGSLSGAQYKGYEDSSWKTVSLPYDFSIVQDFSLNDTENESGNLPGGTGWYRKWFTLPQALDGKRIILTFGNVYENAYIYVNGTLVCENHYGYNSFSVDITDNLVHDGYTLNLIAVKAVNEIPSSRWYSGSGILGDVTMSFVDPVHVALYGTKVTANNDGSVQTAVEVQNDSASSANVKVKATVLDASGNSKATVESAQTTISAGNTQTVPLSASVSNPSLWSPDSPALYTLRTEIYKGDTLTDSYDTEFGFRTIEWNASTGFSINGVKTKIKGVCLHSDQGALGGVQVYDALYRQISTMKEMGVNAVRSSHNVPSDKLISICNKLGIMVMDELFDGWNTAKDENSHDFSEYFLTPVNTSSNKIMGAVSGQAWYQFVATQTIKRDRNAPCVIIWSGGNEIANICATPDYSAIGPALNGIFDTYDSTRPWTVGDNNKLISSIASFTDVVGLNYAAANASSIRISNKPFVSTEASSAVSSRGVYSYGENDSAPQQVHYASASSPYRINAYDASSVYWGNTSADAWYYAITNDWFSGEFMWTGFDYIGEPTPYWTTTGSYENSLVPNSSYFGAADTAGFEKDNYYLYRALWNTDSNTLHLVPGTWNANELGNKSSVPVAVYANGSNIKRINLYLNNTLIGHATATEHTTSAGYKYYTWSAVKDNNSCTVADLSYSNSHSLYPQFKVTYAQGTLSTKAYSDTNGTQEITDTVGTNSVSSGATAVSIVSEVTNSAYTTFAADGESYAYVELTAVDSNSTPVNGYNGTITVGLSGSANAVIAGVDNGNPVTVNKFQQSSVMSDDRQTADVEFFNGKALVIIKTADNGRKDAAVAGATGTVTLSSTAFNDVQRVASASFKVTEDFDGDEFEELCEQTGGQYESTIYDEYASYQSMASELEEAFSGNIYEKYTPSALPDGDYVIIGSNNIATGILTNTYDEGQHAFSFLNNSTISANTNFWSFENQSGGTYYVSTVLSDGSVKYLAFTSGSSGYPYLSDTPSPLTVSVSNDNTVTIGSGSGRYINFWGSKMYAGAYSAGTALTLYKVDKKQVVGYNGGTSTYYYKLDKNGIDAGERYLVVASGAAKALGRNNTTISAGTISISDETASVGSRDYEWVFNSATSTYIKDYDADYYISYNGQTVSIGTASDNNFTVTSKGNGSYVFKYTSGRTTGYLNYNTNTFGYNKNSSSVLRLYKYDHIENVGGTEYLTYEISNPVQFKASSPVENGSYVIYNDAQSTKMLISAVKTVSKSDATEIGLDGYTGYTLSGNQITVPDNSCEWKFTLNSDGTYYITNPDGKYLTINASNKVTLSNTPATGSKITVYCTNGKFVLYNNNNMLDNFSHDPVKFSAWAPGSLSDANDNEKHTLYRLVSSGSSDASQAELYGAIKKATSGSCEPGGYTDVSYAAFLEALENAVNVYSSSNESQYLSAASALNQAIDSLELNIRKFDSTIYKYGYGVNTALDTDAKQYSSLGGVYPSYGGHDFNVQSVSKMKKQLLNDEDIVGQMTSILTGAGITASTANLSTIAEYYAKLYTLQFHGTGVYNAPQAGDVEYNTEFDTGWNFWTKRYTEGTGVDADGNELAYGTEDGASVLGLFSTQLDENNHPVAHEKYDLENGLSYLSPSSHNDSWGLGLQSNKTVSIGGRNVTLVPLNNISVYVPDYFSKENVLSGIPADGEALSGVMNTGNMYAKYSKYYWDTQFPFMSKTDSFGVNTYEYNSTGKYTIGSQSDTYWFRANYNNTAQTAFSTIQKVDKCSIANNKGKNQTGFFPFNYQMSSVNDLTFNPATVENGIDHFGMTFNTKFTLPITPNNKYTNGDDVKFFFSGDDDVLVYIDGIQVLDDGGLHGARSVEINFTQRSVTYQYAYDIAEGRLTTQTDTGATQYVTYTYNGVDENGNVSILTTGLNGQSVNATVPNDIKTALLKLNSLWNKKGEEHELRFFYLERGSSDSNCIIRFNLQPTEGYVHLTDEEIVADYNHDIEYDILENNTLDQTAVDAGSYYNYLGIITQENANKLPSGLPFSFDVNTLDYKFELGKTYTLDGKFGVFTITAPERVVSEPQDIEGLTCNSTYKLKNMQFTGNDSFYVIAEVHKDPIFTNEVYYTYEKITFVPATTIYYEDDFEGIGYADGNSGITYTDGKGSAKFGKWSVVTDNSVATAVQDVDFVGNDKANVYGHDSHYTSFAQYSNASAHKVSVSADNSAGWPKAEFTFAGTGFDLISLTSRETGVFTISVYDQNNVKVASQIVDTYYGYSYGRVYRNAQGEPTLNPTESDGTYNTPMYRADKMVGYVDEDGNELLEVNGETMSMLPSYAQEDGSFSRENVTYFAPDGSKYSQTAAFYTADGTVTDDISKAAFYDIHGNLTTDETQAAYFSPNGLLVAEESKAAYFDDDYSLNTSEQIIEKYGENQKMRAKAYALAYNYAYGYGWLIEENENDPLYQIPVMKIEGLEYGVYHAVIEARFFAFFQHHMNDGETDYYDLYLDAIRVYDPAGKDSGIADTVVAEAYSDDKEAYPDYFEIKDMLIGSQTLTGGDDSSQKGAIFIDGIAVLDGDIEKYKKAGPNNELYLDGGQAVAFSIWATKPVTDIQIGAKVAKGQPDLYVAYGSSFDTKQIRTATDLYYSVNDFKGDSDELGWTSLKIDDEIYYQSDVITIQNTAAEGNILSVTNLKWTFSSDDASAFMNPSAVPEEPVEVMMVVDSATIDAAYSAISMRTADLTVDPYSFNITDGTEPNQKIVTLRTSPDVDSLLVKRIDGTPVKLGNVESVLTEYNNAPVKEWSFTLSEDSIGIYTYTICGVYKNGYTDGSLKVVFATTFYSVNEDEPVEISEGLARYIISRLLDILKQFLAVFGIRF